MVCTRISSSKVAANIIVGRKIVHIRKAMRRVSLRWTLRAILLVGLRVEVLQNTTRGLKLASMAQPNSSWIVEASTHVLSLLIHVASHLTAHRGSFLTIMELELRVLILL